MKTSEQIRLESTRAEGPWKKWGPYLSERQWAPSEDYSDNAMLGITSLTIRRGRRLPLGEMA